MKILFVVGNNLQENTSANISHNAYIKGLLESGYSVDIIMKSNDNIIIDNSMPKFNTKYYEISGVGLLNKYISLYKKKFEHKEEYSSITNLNSNQSSLENNINSKKSFIHQSEIFVGEYIIYTFHLLVVLLKIIFLD